MTVLALIVLAVFGLPLLLRLYVKYLDWVLK